MSGLTYGFRQQAAGACLQLWGRDEPGDDDGRGVLRHRPVQLEQPGHVEGDVTQLIAAQCRAVDVDGWAR